MCMVFYGKDHDSIRVDLYFSSFYDYNDGNGDRVSRFPSRFVLQGFDLIWFRYALDYAGHHVCMCGWSMNRMGSLNDISFSFMEEQQEWREKTTNSRLKSIAFAIDSVWISAICLIDFDKTW